MLNILIVIGSAILMCTLFVLLDVWVSYHWHKCPYCKHCMTHAYTKEVHDKTIHYFHCPECGAWDEVPEDRLTHSLGD